MDLAIVKLAFFQAGPINFGLSLGGLVKVDRLIYRSTDILISIEPENLFKIMVKISDIN